MPSGLIRKSVGGFYYVEASDCLYECRARGVFRKKGLTPMAGDQVVFTMNEDGSGTVSEILPRKNEFVRPPVANLDYIFLIVSICDPAPNLLVLDKLIAVCEYKEIEPVLVLTKNDLGDTSQLEQQYCCAGFQVLSVNAWEEDGMEHLKQMMEGNISALIGNSGAGKSSLLNRLYSDWEIKTADISQKLGRGKHTTRQVELYALPDREGYVADTPGFSTMDLARYDVVRKESLQYCFREFEPYLNRCKFTGCSHTVEKGCAVLEALSEGIITQSRHESYKTMYEDAKQIKEWEL